MISWQFELWRTVAELLPPVLQLRLEHFALQPLALPHSVVCILNRQLRQRGFTAGAVRVIEHAQLAHEDAHGPRVSDDVVHRQKQDVVVSIHSKQTQAKQRSACKIEWPRGFFHYRTLNLSFAVLWRYFDIDVRGRRNYLPPLLALDLDGRAQYFMSADDFVDGMLQCVKVEWTVETHHFATVVRGMFGLELRDKPEPLLSERQRRINAPSLAQRWRRRRLGPASRPLAHAQHQQALLFRSQLTKRFRHSNFFHDILLGLSVAALPPDVSIRYEVKRGRCRSGFAA